MRWKYLIIFSVAGLVISEESNSDPIYKPLVSPEEMEYIDNAEIQEILGNLQVYYDRLKQEATTTTKKPEINTHKPTEETEIPEYLPPRYIPQTHIKPEPQTTYATEKTSTTKRPEVIHNFQPHFNQAEILNHPQVQKMIQESISQAPIPPLQNDYSPPTQKPIEHLLHRPVHMVPTEPQQNHNFQAPLDQYRFQPQVDSAEQTHREQEHEFLHSPIYHSVPEPHTAKPIDIHQKTEDHVLFHQPQLHYQQPQLHDHQTHLHANLETPHVVVPQTQPASHPRQEIEIEYQYQPHARVIGHLTEDQQVRLYKNKSPEINKIAKDFKYHHSKNYHNFDRQQVHSHYEPQKPADPHFDRPELHFPEDDHFESQGAKVELMDKESTDKMMYGNSPGFHLDESESNYYIEPLK